MNKTTKGVIIGGAILIGAILLFSYFQVKQELIPSSGTLYNSWSVDLNNKQLIYSDTSTQDLRANAFKSKHGLIRDSSNYFSDAGENKRFWRFFLKANDIDPDNFRDYSGKKLSGIFSPNTIPGLFHNELESLGFSYNHHVQTASVFVGDQTYCCGSSNCCADPSWMVFPKCCYSHEQTIITGEEAYWAGGYKESIMQDMANKMACYVEGQTTVLADGIYLKSDRSENFVQSYKIYGETQYTGSFICKVNTDELFNELPKTFTRSDGATVNVGGAGVDGKVVFYFGERSYNKYRLTNNQCNLIEIKESEITSNDYENLESCESNIVIIDGCETSTPKYKIEDNVCITINACDDEYNNAYTTLNKCKENIQVPVECTANTDCVSICGDKIPTCESNSCSCSEIPPIEPDKTPYYLYLIPVVIFGLVAFIVWMKIKKPKRRKR